MEISITKIIDSDTLLSEKIDSHDIQYSPISAVSVVCRKSVVLKRAF